MIKHFEVAKVVREKIAKITGELTTGQLNKIPEGFRNNIAWHIGHIVVSTEALCYLRSGVSLEKNIPHINDYQNGSVPKPVIGAEEIQYFLNRLQASLNEITADYQKGAFTTFQPYATMTFGIEMTNMETVFEMSAYHDTLHFGHIQAMRKLV
ncbi:MAG TPA: DinB family protein [Edaphocola sp.]|nr:DinB family protein [Edaphocola sp.]